MRLTRASGRMIVIACAAMNHLDRSLIACLCLALIACPQPQTPTGHTIPPPERALSPSPPTAPDDVVSQPAERPTTQPANTSPASQVSLADVGLDPTAMDKGTAACDDFYRYACGGWSSRAMPSKPIVTSMDALRVHTDQQLRRLLEAASSPKANGTGQAALGQFYAACMDEPAIERARLVGLKPLLQVLRRRNGKPDATAAISALHNIGIWAGFSSRLEPASSSPKTTVWLLDSGTLGLPNRRHYTSGEASMQRLRRKYRHHVARIFQLAGHGKQKARRMASNVLSVEIELARAMPTTVERRRTTDWYELIDPVSIGHRSNAIDWTQYARSLGRTDTVQFAVTSKRYLARVMRLIRRRSGKPWRHYLQWRLLDESIPLLPRAFAAERAAFDTQSLGRAPSLTARWRTCVRLTDNAFGEQLSRDYAQKHFPDPHRRAARALLSAMVRALRQRLDAQVWMSEQATEQSQNKLAALDIHVGATEPRTPLAPPKTRGGLLEQTFDARRRTTARALSGSWTSERAHQVDGFYDPQRNRLWLSAGLLQAPIFAPQRGHAVAFGALALIGGHQLIHSIDDLGARFDATGAARSSWNEDDIRAYRQRATCVIDAAVGIQPAHNPPLMRTHAIREDIADIGGLRLAWDAYKNAASRAPVAPIADGLAPDQQFFVAAAQSLCEHASTQGHQHSVAWRSSARDRINRAISQMSGFKPAFQCTDNSPMVANATCDLW